MKLKIKGPINTIQPYEPGKPIEELEREFNVQNAVKLASNENPVGCSPKVYEAISETLVKVNRYPDPRGFNLTVKLSEKYGVDPENVVLGNGSDEIISLLTTAFLDNTSEAVMPSPSFLMYEICVKAAKSKPVLVPLNNFSIDFDAMAGRVNDDTGIVFLTNPFNPTGSAFSHQQFKSFADKIPDDVLMVVDEAYIEFVKDTEVFDSLRDPLTDPRVITLRTFSKAYGLAGLRIGYGIMHRKIAEILHRIRQPFNVNSLAQVAAIASLEDKSFLRHSIDTVQSGIDFLKSELDRSGIAYIPTHSNFLMIDVRQDATKIFNELLKYGVIVKSMKSYGFDRYIRVNAGTEKENRFFISALKEVLQNADG